MTSPLLNMNREVLSAAHVQNMENRVVLLGGLAPTSTKLTRKLGNRRPSARNKLDPLTTMLLWPRDLRFCELG